MRSSASLAIALLVGCGVRAQDAPLPPEAGTPAGPHATSGAPDPARYDEVGIATWYGEEVAGNKTASGAVFDPAAITAAHRTLALGSYVEVTALATGRTILVLINDRGPAASDRLIDLSRGAAALLGTGSSPMAPVRVRSVLAPPADAAALTAGRAASPRLDTPPALLAALRKRLPQPARVAAPPPRPIAVAAPAPAPSAPPKPGKSGRYLVQVAAFSDLSRAKALAARLDGRVETAGAVHRVRLGPFADRAAAMRARDGAAKHGYGDASIIAP